MRILKQRVVSSLLLVALALVFGMPTQAQEAKKPAAPVITFSGYADAYYAFDNDATVLQGQPRGARQYSYLGYVRNQFSLNTAQITATVAHDDYRGAITLHFGDLNTSAYQPFTRLGMFQQANAGFRVVDKLWFDAGLFLTHIGGEALLPKDNWFTLYSFATTNEPFYQAGARLSYEGSLFQAQLHLLNGYAIFEDNNNDKTLGWFLGFTPSPQFSASLSGTFGNEQAVGTPAANRLYNNLVVSLNPFEPLLIKLQADYATEQINGTPGLTMGTYLASYAALRYAIVSNFFVSGRFEYIANANGTKADVGIIVPAVRGTGLSASLEYRPVANCYIRAEVRSFQFENAYSIFSDANNRPTGSRVEGVVSLGVWF